MTEPRYTPLRERHEALGASFTDFGGWMMPVRYTSDLAEHQAVRTGAGLFDISHMAEFVVSGGPAAPFLDYALAGRLSTMKVGKAKYSLLLDERGGIIDDLIVYRLGDDRFLIIANAGNHDVVAAALRERAGQYAEHLAETGPVAVPLSTAPGPQIASVTDITDKFSLIAVQGPRAEEIVTTITGLEVTGVALDELGYYAWSSAEFLGSPVLIARTGYTGEDGFELLVANELAAQLWDAALAAGEPFNLTPAGLAARDTLRLEAGMPLYGHELSLETAPAQVGLGRVVVADKELFVGKDGLSARDLTDAPVLVGLVAEGRRAGRADYDVYAGEEKVGVITSGALSPTLGHPIAMALVSPSASAVGTALELDVRGTRIPATVTALPFYRRNS
ncbi:glycine cleavage system aminomethyltransferase GcvT [Microbacterium gorillae]|uniref:glycine cleavage system aminomethyltransferase GcvT n=1 Tax=Microbacterium gorillae TaxID=1231063 RepID=UPI00058D7088|nr:glycine cleavage system aminomethyltransferase GcvT [Microbacterium gorillae]